MMHYDVGMATVESARAVRRLALEHPEWVRIVNAALAVASRSQPYGGEFPGARVLQELKAQGGGGQEWIPNLRLLVSYRILEKVGESTRSGRRAYYRFPDPQGVEEALRDIEEIQPAPPRPRLTFIGAGASSGPRDTARTASRLPYEPKSWR
jgi:hypothetical protein